MLGALEPPSLTSNELVSAYRGLLTVPPAAPCVGSLHGSGRERGLSGPKELLTALYRSSLGIRVLGEGYEH